jgi:hypothetical protein
MKKSSVVDATPDPPEWQSAALAAGYSARPEPQIEGVEFSVREWATWLGHVTVTGEKVWLDREVAEGRMTCRRTLLASGRAGTVYRVVKK